MAAAVRNNVIHRCTWDERVLKNDDETVQLYPGIRYLVQFVSARALRFSGARRWVGGVGWDGGGGNLVPINVALVGGRVGGASRRGIGAKNGEKIYTLAKYIIL